jgi:hypothetical protein
MDVSGHRRHAATNWFSLHAGLATLLMAACAINGAIVYARF